jgi:hypothetical protein
MTVVVLSVIVIGKLSKIVQYGGAAAKPRFNQMKPH